MIFKEKYGAEALIELIKGLQFTDLLAFAKILNVEEQDDITDFITEIVYAFSQEPRHKRKEFIKLAKDLATFNKENSTTLGDENGIQE